MKFFPIAFMVTWDEPSDIPRLDVNEMSAWRDYGSLDSVLPVPINIRQTKHGRWPEAPTSSSFSMFGAAAYIAREYVNSRSSN